eukprot:scaffold24557_cov74-Phaeocystis_antarctica.AAC.2
MEWPVELGAAVKDADLVVVLLRLESIPVQREPAEHAAVALRSDEPAARLVEVVRGVRPAAIGVRPIAHVEHICTLAIAIVEIALGDCAARVTHLVVKHVERAVCTALDVAVAARPAGCRVPLALRVHARHVAHAVATHGLRAVEGAHVGGAGRIGREVGGPAEEEAALRDGIVRLEGDEQAAARRLDEGVEQRVAMLLARGRDEQRGVHVGAVEDPEPVEALLHVEAAEGERDLGDVILVRSLGPNQPAEPLVVGVVSLRATMRVEARALGEHVVALAVSIIEVALGAQALQVALAVA